MPHFHIPLQSASNKILALMQRRYQADVYKDRVQKIKSTMPHACIGVDVIVGFPSETNDDFMQTFNFLHEIDISYLHVFTYSERANTKALDIQDVVPMSVRQDRCTQLRSLSEKKKRQFYEQYLHTNRKVLFEEEKKGALMHGFTDNYIKVNAQYDESLVNTLKNASLDNISADGNVHVNI
jgi:threonylcarbamoyladenosine tRNA methylthiotransferase MtaB